MNRWLQIALGLCLCLSTLVEAGFDGKPVQSITLRSKEATQTLDTPTILDSLSTHEGSPFSQEKFDRDLKALSKDYEYVQPRLSESAGQIQITLTLSPRPMIEKIAYDGNHHLGTGSLKKELGIEPGTLLDRPKLNEGISKIRQLYLKKGYFRAKVRYITEMRASGQIKLIIKIDEGPSGKIRDLKYENMTDKDLKPIADELILKKYNFFTSWYTGRGQYVEDAMDFDCNRMVHQLQDMGLADATVTGRVKEIANGVEIDFLAHRGAVYHIRHIDIDGVAEEYLARVSPLINIKEGDVYSPSKLRKIVEKISDLYNAKGYCDALVNYTPQLVDPTHQLYDVNFKVIAGQQFKVGMVRFSGNYITRPRVMAHESLMIPGELVNSKKLESTEKRLMNTGYFKSVHIRTVDSKPEGFPEGKYKDVVIEVEEADSTTTASLKFGASIQGGAYGGVSTSFNNFYLKGFKNLFRDGLSAIRGNGEHLSLDASFSSHVNEYVLSWTDPYFLESKWAFGIDLDIRNQHFIERDEYSNKSEGITFNGFYSINNFLRFKLAQSVRKEDTRLFGTKLNDPQARQAIHNGVYSTQTTALMYDSTNRLTLPSLGFRSSLGASLTEGPSNYARVDYLNAYFWTPNFLPEGTFKIRADINLLIPALGTSKEDIPLSQRLFVGGDDSLRGYQFGRIGRKDEKGNALGGMTRFVYNAEYLYRISDMFALFAFCDNAAVSNYQGHMGKNYHSMGYGLRIDLLGKFPVVFGMGYPLTDKDDHSIVRRFFFSIGARF